MKTLIVIRHAKAVAHDEAQTDFERALAPRGHRDALVMSQRVANEQPVPDVMLVSTARRTTETASYFTDAWGIGAHAVHRDARIYDAPLRTLLTLIAELPNDVSSAVIVGHNPSVSDLVYYLTSGEYGGMATCTVVVVEMKSAASWDEVAAGTGRVRHSYEPESASH